MSYDFTNGEFLGSFGTGFNYPFTLAAWVRLPATGQDGDFQTVLAWGVDNTSDNNQVRISMGSAADEVFRVVSQDNTGGNTATDWQFVDGTYNDVWVPIVATCGSGTQTIYVATYSGSASGSTRSIFGDPDELCIGKRHANTRPWVGKIAEVVVANSIWNQSQIEAYMAGGVATDIDSSCYYYPLKIDDDTPADASGNGGPTLSMTGTVDFSDPPDHPPVGSNPLLLQSSNNAGF